MKEALLRLGVVQWAAQDGPALAVLVSDDAGQTWLVQAVPMTTPERPEGARSVGRVPRARHLSLVSMEGGAA